MLKFSISESIKRKKDIENAIEIYLSKIDMETSYTDTNQIKEHILINNKNEERLLFFYNLYLNDQLFGFAEYGYLPKTETIVIDYICTKERNHCAFYTFYKLTIEDICKKLKNKHLHVKYIITEISLNQQNGLYCDADSNYFRKMLSMDNFVLLKYPYYQPSFNQKPLNFAIAIKSISGSSVNTSLSCNSYIEIINELYNSHYGKWYEKYLGKDTVYDALAALKDKITKQISPQKDNNKIPLVNCPIFEVGKCKNVNIEPLTVSGKIKKRFTHAFLICFWLLVTVISTILIFSTAENVYIKISSFVSLTSGIITIFLYLRDLFRN